MTIHEIELLKVSLVTNSKKLFDLKSPLFEDLTKIVHVIRIRLQNEESAYKLRIPLTFWKFHSQSLSLLQCTFSNKI